MDPLVVALVLAVAVVAWLLGALVEQSAARLTSVRRLEGPDAASTAAP